MFTIGYYVTKTTPNEKEGPTAVVDFGFNPLFEKNRLFQPFNMKLFHNFPQIPPGSQTPQSEFLVFETLL